MGQRCGIDDNARRRRTERLDRVDQMTLVVGLNVLDPQRWIRGACHRFEICDDLDEGRAPVYARLPGAEQIEIRSIEDEHEVVAGLALRRIARHGSSLRRTQLRTGSTIVIRRSSMI